MTTITFEQKLNIDKFKFKNLLDFKKYIDENFFITELKELDESEITPEIRKELEEAKKMDISEFVNI